MMKRITLFAFVAVLVGAFVYAEGTASTKPAATSTKSTSSKSTMAKAPRVEGTIVSVDAAKHTLTVTVGADQKTYTLTSKTSYMDNGKKTKIADLKAGQNVSIEADSKNVAHIVEVKAAAAPQQ